MPLDPTTIPGLKVWLDASDPASFVYSSGTLVSQWLDKSGTGYHFTQATPAQQPSRSGSRNGLPTVAFDGARYMRRDQTAPFTNSACSIFIVCLETTHPQAYVGFLVAQTTSGEDHAQPYAFTIDAGDTGIGTSFSCDRVNSKALIAQGHPCPFAVYSVTMAPQAGGISIYKNGVAGTPNGAAVSGQPAPPGLCLGTRWLSGAPNMTYGLRGEIAEVIIYDRVVTTTERQQIEQHLREKWFLNLNLADSVTVTDVPDPQNFFTPVSIPNCVGWWDAEKLGIAHGGAVSAWPNLAPGGFALTPVSSPAPVMRTGEFGQNGRPVVRFTAGQGAFYATGTGVDRDFTCLFVARIWGANKQRVIGSWETYGGTDLLLGWHGGDWDMCYMQAWFGPSSGIPTGTTAKLYSADQVSPTYAGRMFSDGVLLRSGTAGNGWKNSFALNRCYSGQYSDVEFAEVIFYSRKLTDVERQQAEAYLRQKWLTPGAALTLPLSDAVAVSDAAELGFQWAQFFADTVTPTDVLGLDLSLSFADGVNVSDELAQPFGAFHEVTADETVTTSDFLSIEVGEYILPCIPDPVVGEFLAGQSVVGTWYACAKKGILGLGAYAPAIIRRDLAAEPAGLSLGGEPALFVGQKAPVTEGGLYLGGYAPGFSLSLTPPRAGLGLRGRIPRNVGIEPPVYEAGLELGGHTPKFVGKEPPVTSAGLRLGGVAPAFKFSHRLPAPAAGLQLGAGPPVQVETILILPVYEWPVDLAGVVESDQVLLSTGTPVVVDLLSSPAQAVTLNGAESVPSDDLDGLECV